RRVVDPRPARLTHGQPAPVGAETPLQHPVRLALLVRDETDHVFREALGGPFGFDLGCKAVFVLVDVDSADAVDGFLHGRHLLPSAAVSRTAGWIYGGVRQPPPGTRFPRKAPLFQAFEHSSQIRMRSRKLSGPFSNRRRALRRKAPSPPR